MAGKNLKQGFLRKALNDHKKKSAAVKKIDSPLAKYTDGGQLMCVICKTSVKSETIWPIHLSSKNHKENLAETKRSLAEKDNLKKGGNVSFKRPSSPASKMPPGGSKKIKSILKNPGHSKSPGLPSDFFDNSGGQTSISATSMTNGQAGKAESIKQMAGEAEQVKEGESSTSADLPEGFFDDPIQDAKVRNVEYKDPIEEEWEKYKKEIKEETAQSAQIIADDQEEATTERQIDEIEEQIRHLSRVVDLANRKEQVQAREKKKEISDENVSSDDESDYEEFLDWRVKSSNKKTPVNKLN